MLAWKCDLMLVQGHTCFFFLKYVVLSHLVLTIHANMNKVNSKMTLSNLYFVTLKIFLCKSILSIIAYLTHFSASSDPPIEQH